MTFSQDDFMINLTLTGSGCERQGALLQNVTMSAEALNK